MKRKDIYPGLVLIFYGFGLFSMVSLVLERGSITRGGYLSLGFVAIVYALGLFKLLVKDLILRK